MNTSSILQQIDEEISRLQQAKVILTGIDGKRGPGRPKASHIASKSVAAKPVKQRSMSAEGKAKVAAAQKARWAKLKKAAKTATPMT